MNNMNCQLNCGEKLTVLCVWLNVWFMNMLAIYVCLRVQTTINVSIAIHDLFWSASACVRIKNHRQEKSILHDDARDDMTIMFWKRNNKSARQQK